MRTAFIALKHKVDHVINDITVVTKPKYESHNYRLLG